MPGTIVFTDNKESGLEITFGSEVTHEEIGNFMKILKEFPAKFSTSSTLKKENSKTIKVIGDMKAQRGFVATVSNLTPEAMQIIASSAHQELNGQLRWQVEGKGLTVDDHELAQSLLTSLGIQLPSWAPLVPEAVFVNPKKLGVLHPSLLFRPPQWGAGFETLSTVLQQQQETVALQEATYSLTQNPDGTCTVTVSAKEGTNMDKLAATLVQHLSDAGIAPTQSSKKQHEFTFVGLGDDDRGLLLDVMNGLGMKSAETTSNTSRHPGPGG